MNYIRVTDLVDYLICPRKVYFKLVLGLEEEKREEMLKGEIVHKVFEEFNDKEEEIVYEILEPMPFEKIYNLYYNAFLEILDSVLSSYEEELKEFDLDKEELKLEIIDQFKYEIEDRAKNVYQTMRALDLYGIELWDALEPKIKSEVELLSDDLKLVGRIDRIEFYKDIAIPVEIKTSNRIGFIHKFQLHAYALLIRDNFSYYEIPLGYVYYTKLKKKKEVRFSDKVFKMVIEVRNKILDMIEEQKMPEERNERFCEKCAFKEICLKSKGR